MIRGSYVITGGITGAVGILVSLTLVSCLNVPAPISPPSEVPPAAPTMTRVIPNG